VYTDPHAKLGALRPFGGREIALHFDCGRYGIRGAVEGGEVRVALRVDDLAAAGGTGNFDQATVLGPNVAIPDSEGSHEVRRALDVGEEEGDGATREVFALVASRSVRQGRGA
jgi:hypothetical protein